MFTLLLIPVEAASSSRYGILPYRPRGEAARGESCLSLFNRGLECVVISTVAANAFCCVAPPQLKHDYLMTLLLEAAQAF